MFKWDDWQEKAINYVGSITLRCGRQTGKSTTVSKRRADQMLKYVGSKSLLIAPAQRQSSELFIKLMGWLEIKNQELLAAAGGFEAKSTLNAKANMEAKRQFEYDHGIYNELPTKTTVILKEEFSEPQSKQNQGSICYSLPAGKTGIYLRTYALDFLDIDEAAYVPDNVYTAVKPMLAVAEKKRDLGWETLLSTPFGKGGFFYDSHQSSDYKQFHVSAEDCPRIGKEFLRKERARMTRIEYAQEYKAEFIDEFNQLFPTALIKKCMQNFIGWEFSKDYNRGRKYYLGLDVARYGEDENAFVVAEMEGKNVKIVFVETTERKSLTDTAGRVLLLDERYHFSRLFIDDQGIGAGVTDILIEKLGRRVVGLNNAKRTLDKEGKKGKIFKEDLYSNALVLMEKEPPLINIISNLKLLKSLKSITFEYTADKNLKIYGKYSHLAEAYVRACWCVKMRGLRLYVR